ncbi:MAG TPA: hypothetical protein VNE21_02370, partial [Mycobacteriales bacterium]|nr:hypothetical protein [Mycobacteriales bacterium]
VFLDDDARPRPDALARLTAAYTDPGVVGATGRVVEPASNRVVGKESKLRRALHLGAEGTFTAYGYPRRITRTDAPRDVECMSGCFMSARVPVAAALRFDERLSGYGLAEDEDFSYRLSRRGRIRYVPDAVVDHDNAGFGGRDRVAFNRAVVVHRAYLFAKNFPQTPRARAGFTLLVPALVAHRLLNGDLAGVRGLLRGAHEAREARRTGEWAL